jgi:hypothetical protein
VAAIAGDALVTLTWGSPSNTCGLQITNYVVQSSPAGGSVSVALGTTGGRATVTNLANDASYTFTVAAVTSAGMGPAAPSSAVTPRCTAINTLQLSVTRTLYWSARGTCSPYNGTIDEKFTSLFGVVTHKYLSFSAAGSNPAGSYYWYGDPPIATSHTTLYVTLTDSKGNTISSWIVYN